VTLKAKITLALGLAFTAAMVGLLPAYLALSSVEARFAAAYVASEGSAEGAVAQAIHDQLRFGLLSLAPGAASVFLVLAALALLAERQIITPLRAMRRSLSDGLPDTLTDPATSWGRDEIRNLSGKVTVLVQTLRETGENNSARERQLQSAVESFRVLTDLAADFVWQTDADGCLTWFSGALADQAQAEALVGRPLGDVLSVAVTGDQTRALELTSHRPLDKLLCRSTTALGEARYLRLSGVAITDQHGAFCGYRGIGHDVTEAITAEERADSSAFRDPLTGLANTSMVRDRIAQALAARALSKGEVAVIHIDLDYFRTVNDTRGYDTGDGILQQVGERLGALIGPQDTLARIGGDAFLILQANGAQPEAAELMCRSVLSDLRQSFLHAGHHVTLSASLGCAIAAPDAADATQLMRSAEVAMYHAKDDGRDTFRIHEPAMAAARQANIDMEHDLSAALQADAIDIRYGPLMQADTNALSGFEARLSWQRPGHGMVSPDRFLPLAEETGLIVPLSSHLLKTACRTAMSWPDLRLRIKLSPSYFLHDSLLPTLIRALRDNNLSAHRLELEITEAALLDATDTALFQCDALRELGVRLVLGGFGKGPSSLQHIQRVPFDVLKLDRSFVSRVASDPKTARIVGALVQLGSALELETCAAGVKTKDQANALTKLGCQTLQGPHFGAPMSADDAFSMVRSAGIMPGAPKAETHL